MLSVEIYILINDSNLPLCGNMLTIIGLSVRYANIVFLCISDLVAILRFATKTQKH